MNSGLWSPYITWFFSFCLSGSSEAEGVSYSLASEIRRTANKILRWCKFGFIFERFSFCTEWFYTPIFVFRLLAAFLKPVWPGRWILLYLFQGETLETVTQAALCLFTAQPQLADQVCGKNCNKKVKVVLGDFVYNHILKNLYFPNSTLKQACAMSKYREQN